MRDPEDYPKDIWNKSSCMTVEDSNKYLDEYDKKHKKGFFRDNVKGAY